MTAVRPAERRPAQSSPEADAATALRDLFARHAGAVPLAEDVASVAVGRAQRIRSRRLTTGSLAVTLVFVLVLTAAVTLRAWSTGENADSPLHGLGLAGDPQVAWDLEPSEFTAPVQPAGMLVDVRVGDRLWDATQGKWRTLVVDGADLTVVRTRLGWLAGDETGLWLMRTQGSSVQLLPGGERWTVNADGTQIAAITGTTLRLAKITIAGLEDIANGTVAAGDTPIGFLSTSVLLATADRGRFAIWRQSGGYRSTTGYVQLFGSPRFDTFGVVSSGGTTCLVQAAGATGQLKISAYAGCHELLGAGVERAAVSPDGKYLASPFNGGMWIIDLDRSVATAARDHKAGPTWVATCSADPQATPVWISNETVVVAANDGYVTCGVDGGQRPIALPSGVPGGATLVPIRR